MITIHVTYPLLGLKKSLHGARKGSPFFTLGPGTSWAVTFYNVIGNAGSHPGKEILQIATSCGRNAGRERDFVVHPWCVGEVHRDLARGNNRRRWDYSRGLDQSNTSAGPNGLDTAPADVEP